jgi:hypothetical protein
MTREDNMKPVLVTTTHRGVFFGYLETDDSPDSVRLTRARNVVYWSADTRGFLGLAKNGPTEGCRIGPEASITLYGITCVADMTDEAVERFEAAPWS